jgi:hypothetical protein
MNFDSLSADPFGRTDLAVKNGISNVAPLTSWHKHRRPAAARAAATLAFAAGLLAAALGAGRTSQRGSNRPPSEPARTASASSRLRSSSLCPISPTSAPATRDVDELYRLLIGPPAAASSSSCSSSRLRAAPNDDAAGSVRRWGPR